MSQQVLNPGIDPTAFTAIQGADLAQMVSQATFATGVGGIIVTADSNSGTPTVPNANVDTTLVNYVWIRIGNVGTSGNFATAYVWNPNNPNPTNPSLLLNWNPITTLAGGSINGSAIVANSIPASALIGGITAAQVNGLTNLMNTALVATSSPSAGAISGTFLAGFSLTAGAVTASSFSAGAIASNIVFAGQVVEPYNIMTDTATASSVIMASNASAVPSWVSKAILAMADPGAGNDTGYIPVYGAGGTYSLLSPSAALSSTTLSAITAIAVTAITFSTTTIPTVSSKTYTITVTSALPSSTPGYTFPVTFSGGLSGFLALNGSWTGVIVSATQFTVLVTGTPSGSYASGNYPTAMCYFSLLGTQTNVASLVGLSSTTPSQVQVNFSSNYANTNYLPFVSQYDNSLIDVKIAKVVNKAIGSVTLSFYSISANAFVALPTSTVHLICI